MARRNDHSRKQLRAMAISTARKIVSEEGFQALSARRVAREIGYTVGTLYLIFKNLDDMILALNEQTLTELYTSLESSTESQANASELVEKICLSYLSFAIKHRHLWVLVFEHELPAQQEMPSWYAEKIAMGIHLIELVLCQLVPKAKTEIINQSARSIWGGVHGVCMLAVSKKLDLTGIESAEDQVVDLTQKYLRGLCYSYLQA